MYETRTKGIKIEERVHNLKENMRNDKTKRFQFRETTRNIFFLFLYFFQIRKTIETRLNSDLFRKVSYFAKLKKNERPYFRPITIILCFKYLQFKLPSRIREQFTILWTQLNIKLEYWKTVKLLSSWCDAMGKANINVVFSFSILWSKEDGKLYMRGQCWRNVFIFWQHFN